MRGGATFKACRLQLPESLSHHWLAGEFGECLKRELSWRPLLDRLSHGHSGEGRAQFRYSTVMPHNHFFFCFHPARIPPEFWELKSTNVAKVGHPCLTQFIVNSDIQGIANQPPEKLEKADFQSATACLTKASSGSALGSTPNSKSLAPRPSMAPPSPAKMGELMRASAKLGPGGTVTRWEPVPSLPFRVLIKAVSLSVLASYRAGREGRRRSRR